MNFIRNMCPEIMLLKLLPYLPEVKRLKKVMDPFITKMAGTLKTITTIFLVGEEINRKSRIFLKNTEDNV